MTVKFQFPASPPVDNPELAQFLVATKRVAEDAIARITALEDRDLFDTINHGIIASGRFKPDPNDSRLHYALNNGAHILLPPDDSCAIVLKYVNGTSAGTITTSDFTHVTGSPDTTAGNIHYARITVILGHSLLEWENLQ